MITKKFYITPSCKYIVIEESDIIATSNPESPDTDPEQKNSVFLHFVSEQEEEGFAD